MDLAVSPVEVSEVDRVDSMIIPGTRGEGIPGR